MDREALKGEIEKWFTEEALTSITASSPSTSTFKFDVNDGLGKLLELGLATEVPQTSPGESPSYQVR